jgi:hypothetical protein
MPLVKNLAFWIVVLVLPAALYNLFQSSTPRNGQNTQTLYGQSK